MRAQLPDRADVLVVGAGPSGAIVAHTLATRGFSVVCLDQDAAPAALSLCRELPDATWYDAGTVTELLANLAALTSLGSDTAGDASEQRCGYTQAQEERKSFHASGSFTSRTGIWKEY